MIQIALQQFFDSGGVQGPPHLARRARDHPFREGKIGVHGVPVGQQLEQLRAGRAADLDEEIVLITVQ
jgi:hypothetical protein